MWRLLVVCLLVLGVAAALSDTPDAPKRNTSEYKVANAPTRKCSEGEVYVRNKCRKMA